VLPDAVSQPAGAVPSAPTLPTEVELTVPLPGLPPVRVLPLPPPPPVLPGSGSPEGP
jgi:hypothetical protein